MPRAAALRVPSSSPLENELDWQMRAAGLPPWECEFKFHSRRRWRATGYEAGGRRMNTLKIIISLAKQVGVEVILWSK